MGKNLNTRKKGKNPEKNIGKMISVKNKFKIKRRKIGKVFRQKIFSGKILGKYSENFGKQKRENNEGEKNRENLESVINSG